MRTILNIALSAMIFLMLVVSVAPASLGEANVYFNAATKKYLRGNFPDALANLEKAHDLDPNNDKINEFTLKILLEAAGQSRLNKNNQQANEYLDKAKKISPDNPKVLDMDKLLNPDKVKAAEKEKVRIAQEQKNEEKRRQGKSIEDQLQQISKKQVETTGQMEKRIQELMEKQQKTVKRGPAQQFVGEMKEWQIIFFALWSIFVTVGSVVLLVFAVIKNKELNEIKKRFAEQESQLKTAVEEKAALLGDKSNLSVEIEKVKERFKFEHQCVENMQKEIVENKKREEQLLKTEFEMKNKEIEQRIRSEMTMKYEVPDGLQEHFRKHQEEKFMKYVSATAAPKPEEEADPVLVSARERIALMAQNLYEYAPGTAVDFITKMARNENPLIRTNIVQALANIAKPETFELLFGLYADSDQRVKREVLRNLKILNQRIMNGEVVIEQPTAEKIKDLLATEKGKGEWIV